MFSGLVVGYLRELLPSHLLDSGDKKFLQHYSGATAPDSNEFPFASEYLMNYASIIRRWNQRDYIKEHER